MMKMLKVFFGNPSFADLAAISLLLLGEEFKKVSNVDI